MKPLKNLVLGMILALTASVGLARDWNANVAVSTPNGFISFQSIDRDRLYRHHHYHRYPRPGVIYAPPPVVYPAYVPPPVIAPCYNCGRYPQGNPHDPYRNHHHLQRDYHHHHYHW